MSRSSDRPFLIRVAGLPASAVTQLRSPELLAHIEQWLRLDSQCTLARERLADELYEWIGAAEAVERRELLALRRDCHNGRPLEKYRRRPLWQRVTREGASAREVVELEARLGRLRATISRTFRQRRCEAVESLLASAADAGFRRGLSLASPTLSQRLASGIADATDLSKLPARRRRKLESSLLRYVSRAATKLSPFSTLTRVAVGQLVGEELGSSIRWATVHWQEHSLVRSRRYLTEQLVEAWQRHPAVRGALPLVVNPSIEKVGNRLHFLRPPAWRIAAAGSLRARPLMLVRAEADSVVAEVLGLVASETPTIVDLVSRLATLFEIEPVKARAVVDKVLDLGLVSLRLPWNDGCDVLEAELLDGLRRYGGPRQAVESLESLLAAQSGFAHARDATAALHQIALSLESAWRALIPEAGLEGLALWRPHANEVFEDVMMKPEDRSHPGVSMSAAQAEATLDALHPWLQLSFLTDQRFDFLHTIIGAVHRSRPGVNNIGLLDLFAEIQSLWREFVAHERKAKGAWGEPFNPLGLTVIDELASLREALFQQLRETVAVAEEGSISSAAVAEIVARIPCRYRVPIEPCAFVQPTDTRGERWVVNQIFEGTGRFSSRYASLLSGRRRSRFLDAFQRRSSRLGAQGAVELIDLPWNHGDNLAVHPALTRLALSTPGENFGPLSPPARAGYREAVTPQDLRVRIPTDSDALPELIGGEGRRLMAVHLGGVASRFLPSWLQFVSLWGPRRAAKVLPAANWRQEGGVEVSDRWTTDQWILRRKRWRIPCEVLRDKVGRADVEGFLNLHLWLRGVGIPDRVYLIEKAIEGGSERRKPQYLDLSCPLFVELLQRSMGGDSLVLEEALPVPEAFPFAYDQERRAQEIQLDALSLRDLASVE